MGPPSFSAAKQVLAGLVCLQLFGGVEGRIAVIALVLPFTPLASGCARALRLHNPGEGVVHGAHGGQASFGIEDRSA